MTETKTRSKPYQVVSLIYRGGWEASGKSWMRLNPALRDTLNATIIAGLKFEPADFADICKDFKGHYWFGCDSEAMFGERFFTLACKTYNLSACQSFEAWKDRKPLMWEKTRLHVSRRFIWKGLAVTVTSINGNALTACHYKSFYTDGRGVDDPIKRYKITHEDLAAARKYLKKTKEQLNKEK